jgi:hypothetical protein
LRCHKFACPAQAGEQQPGVKLANLLFESFHEIFFSPRWSIVNEKAVSASVPRADSEKERKQPSVLAERRENALELSFICGEIICIAILCRGVTSQTVASSVTK